MAILLYVNLLGLRIGVALAKGDPNDPTQSDTAIVTIGDSTIKLPCNKDGLIEGEDTRANLEITLIKGNRTAVTNSMVTGSRAGYDVFGGGATQDVDGAAVEGGLPGNENHRPDNAGYAGGFVGHNKEGLFERNQMVYCDVVRGTRAGGPVLGYDQSCSRCISTRNRAARERKQSRAETTKAATTCIPSIAT